MPTVPDRRDACARVLAKLRANFRQWVSTPELNRVGGWRATARIYDLRRAGFAIASRQVAGQEFHEYCLLELFPTGRAFRPEEVPPPDGEGAGQVGPAPAAPEQTALFERG